MSRWHWSALPNWCSKLALYCSSHGMTVVGASWTMLGRLCAQRRSGRKGIRVRGIVDDVHWSCYPVRTGECPGSAGVRNGRKTRRRQLGPPCVPSVRRRKGDRPTRAEVVRIVEIVLPVVSQADGRRQLGSEPDLVLYEEARRLFRGRRRGRCLPVESASTAARPHSRRGWKNRTFHRNWCCRRNAGGSSPEY